MRGRAWGFAVVRVLFTVPFGAQWFHDLTAGVPRLILQANGRALRWWWKASDSVMTCGRI